LLSLINDILDLSKIEAGHMEVEIKEFDPEPLIDLCIQTAQPMLKNEKVKIVKKIGKKLPKVSNDENKIKQILLNLLSNAAKFTAEGKITVQIQQRDEYIDIGVSDTGIGISEEALPRVFDEFQQADISTTREYGGTGLGLSISRTLAQLLGGDLTATSIEGKGSTFTLSIPVTYQ